LLFRYSAVPRRPSPKRSPAPLRRVPSLHTRLRSILTQARVGLARTVNTTQVVTNWLLGRELVEAAQHGSAKARYGDAQLARLATRLKREFGPGYSLTNLKLFRQFYLAYPALLPAAPIGHTPCDQSSLPSSPSSVSSISHTPCDQSSWRPGQLHSHLAWSLYRLLLRIDSPPARAFYEIEAAGQAWSARELERQIASLLYERLARSRDRRGVLRLARKGQEIVSPADAFKDPFVIEFLGLPESHRLAESDVESALVANLQTFLLELGKGFAFVSRQERITLDGDHFYLDLVFYHAVLKCYVLIDIKVGKLNHADLGQLQLYVNYFDRERRTAGDQPTLGLILCTEQNDAMVRYVLGNALGKTIFTRRYQLHLPTEVQLRAQLKRGLRAFK
jgi:predicted nuclease of restriction endonuclease-like (RecB) superfamily